MSKPTGSNKSAKPLPKGKAHLEPKTRSKRGAKSPQDESHEESPAHGEPSPFPQLVDILEKHSRAQQAAKAEAEERIHQEIEVVEEGPRSLKLALSPRQLEVLLKASRLSGRGLASLLTEAIGQGIRGVERDIPLWEAFDRVKHPERAEPRKPVAFPEPIKLRPRKHPKDLYALLRSLCPSWSRERLERLDVSLPGLSDSIVAERHPSRLDAMIRETEEGESLLRKTEFPTKAGSVLSAFQKLLREAKRGSECQSQ
jgi:hypothetical protein